MLQKTKNSTDKALRSHEVYIRLHEQISGTKAIHLLINKNYSVTGTPHTFGNKRASAHQNSTQKPKNFLGPKFHICEPVY
jgi:hypothetical protein